jgi:hypothetical protein
LDLSAQVSLGGFEIKTFRVDPEMRTLAESDLMESEDVP